MLVDKRPKTTSPAEESCFEDICDLTMNLVAFVARTKGVAIRCRDAEQRLPFLRRMGHDERSPRCLDQSIEDAQTSVPCLCGDIILGRPSPLPKEISEYGSYHRERITEHCREALAASPDHQRGGCCDDGFETLAIIPMQEGTEAIGVLHLSDERSERLDTCELNKLEGIARSVGRLIERTRHLEQNARPNPLRVLFVDDDPILRRMLPVLLKSLGYETEVAEDGREALDLMKDRRFDVVITDLDMPVMDGLTLMHELRQRYGPYGPALVVVSGDIGSFSAEESDRLQVTASLNKPLDLDTLDESIRLAAGQVA